MYLGRMFFLAAIAASAMFPPLVSSAAPVPDLVVMVKAGHGPGTRTESGAGLVVSQTSARTVLVTALHVVRDREQVNATEVGVEFNMLRGKSFSALLSAAYVDEALDLAVLFVDHAVRGVPDLPARIIGEAVSPSSLDELAGAKVQFVGAARGPWSAGPSGDTISRSADGMLRIQSNQARAGASGGGVFDSFGRLVGMVSSIDSNTGELVVVPMSRIKQRLLAWSIEYGLGTAAAPTGAPELLELIRKTTYVTVALAPGETQNQSIQVETPDHIKRLMPSFRLVFPDSSTLEPLQLKSPDFRTVRLLPPVKLRAELWMDTPDGRKTGPVPLQLDLEQSALDRIKNLPNYEAAMARAALASQSSWYRMVEENARRSAARSADVNASHQAQVANVQEDELRRMIPARYTVWSIRCDGVNERWTCYPSGLVGRNPDRGRLDKVVHAIRVGNGAKRLTIQVPVDHSVEVDAFIKRRAEQLLSEGADSIHGEVALTDGRLLGPKPLCEVDKSHGTSLRMRCLPPARP